MRQGLVIWLDGDDVISPEDQRRILDVKRTVLNDELEAIYLRYVYPPFKQWRERMARRSLFVEKKLIWKEPVHEVIDGIDAQKVRYFDDIAILHDTPSDRIEAKKHRNISILRKNFTSSVGSDRSLYIYAVECLHSLLKEEFERIIERFFLQVRSTEYRYEILCKMYDFYTHFQEPRRALDALVRAIVEDPSRAEAYYRLGAHMNRSDRPAAAIPLLTLASTIPLPGYGTPELDAYGCGPWQSLARSHFRVEQWEAASQAARQALQHGPPAAKWLVELAQWEAGFAWAPLPPEWQEWTDGNLARGVPRCTVIRILEENGSRAESDPVGSREGRAGRVKVMRIGESATRRPPTAPDATGHAR